MTSHAPQSVHDIPPIDVAWDSVLVRRTIDRKMRCDVRRTLFDGPSTVAQIL